MSVGQSAFRMVGVRERPGMEMAREIKIQCGGAIGIWNQGGVAQQKGIIMMVR